MSDRALRNDVTQVDGPDPRPRDAADEARTQLALVDRGLAPLGPRAAHRLHPTHAWIDREAVASTMSDRRTPMEATPR
jgi:hypothetical protein